MCYNLNMNNCPNCGHDLVNILYGMPTEKMIDLAKLDGIALGGYNFNLDRPSLYCYGCNLEL